MQACDALSGKTVIVTRSPAQAQNIGAALQHLGAAVVHFPVINIRPVKPIDGATKTLQQLASYDLVIFISTNAVHYAMELAEQLGLSFQHNVLAVVGAATQKALENYECTVSISTTTKFSSEALLEHRSLQQLGGQKVLIIRGVGGREHLRQVLESRGAQTDYAEVYERHIPSGRNPMDLSQLPCEDTAVLIYSAEAAQNLWALCTDEERQWLVQVTAIVGSSRIAGTTGAMGLKKNPVIAENPGDHAMLEALTDWSARACQHNATERTPDVG